MPNNILNLQSSAQPLEPDAATREALRGPVIQYAEDFLSTIDSCRAFIQEAGGGAGILDLPVQEQGRDIGELLSLLKREVDTPGLNPASGGHLGYIPGGGIYTASLGDYLADVTNRYAGMYFASPGAVRMENHLLRWMAQVVGYPASFAGNLTSGGSVANLIAIATARDAMNIKSRDVESAPIYLTAQVHHSVQKAIRIAGLAESPLRIVPMDTHYRMDVQALAQQIAADKAAGLRPWLVVGSAGTTDTGAVDPLHAIADVCARENLWFHLDAAYGGFFILTAEGKEKLSGMERSDSVTVDPHKGLFLPYGCGAVLVKNREALYKTHHYLAAYMQDTVDAVEELNPADLSPELTKHFRGLRLWLPLMVHGLAPFRAALQEKLELTRWFREQVALIPGMETGPEPDLSVTFFRLRHSGWNESETNERNERLVRDIHADGRVFLSSTRLHGQVWIRFACLCFRTHLSTVQQCLDMLREHSH